MAKHLNPLEKEFLIRQFKSSRRITLSDFCTANHISEAAFRKWLQQYNEGGLEGLARTDKEIREVLPEGIDRTDIEYHIDRMRYKPEFEEALRQYVKYYNEKRPCYAIGYDTPENYRKRYYKGELGQRKTFEDRILSTEPKFVKKKRNTLTSAALSESVSTFENENDEKIT